MWSALRQAVLTEAETWLSLDYIRDVQSWLGFRGDRSGLDYVRGIDSLLGIYKV